MSSRNTARNSEEVCRRTEIASESCLASGVDHFLSLRMGLVVKFLTPNCAWRNGAARRERIPYMVVGVDEDDRGESLKSFCCG